MKEHPQLKEFSSQSGFAELLGRSESLIARVEIGKMDLNHRLVKDIVRMTGVAKSWLTSDQLVGTVIPAESGMPLTHGEVMAKIEAEIARNHQDATENFGKTSSLPIQNRIAASWLNLVEEAVLEGLNRGDTRLMDEITKILLRYPVPSGDAE